MKNAEVLLKNGHDFTELSIKTNGRVSSELFSYKIFFNNKCIDTVVTKDLTTVDAMLLWLNQKYDSKILDDAEKQYLAAVIKPFRDRVRYIGKSFAVDDETKADCYIFIRFNDGSSDMDFPVFRKSDMYNGMKMGKAYTLEELGMDE